VADETVRLGFVRIFVLKHEQSKHRDRLTRIIEAPPEGGGMPSTLSPRMLAEIGSLILTSYLCKSFIVSIPPAF